MSDNYTIDNMDEAIGVANQFSRGFELCVKEHFNSLVGREYIKMGAPIIVNGCIACEIYLKVLTYPKVKEKEHNLKILFDNLKEPQIKNIINIVNIDEKDFYIKLDKIKNAFVIARYCYEKDNDVEVELVFLTSLIGALKEEINKEFSMEK